MREGHWNRYRWLMAVAGALFICTAGLPVGAG